jgi:hypothetical protein
MELACEGKRNGTALGGGLFCFGTCLIMLLHYYLSDNKTAGTKARTKCSRFDITTTSSRTGTRSRESSETCK